MIGIWLYFCVVILLAAATLLPLSRREIWWIRGLDFPRLQLAFLIAASMLWGAILLATTAQSSVAFGLLLSAVLLTYQGKWILPYTRLAKLEVVAGEANTATDRRIRIITANVLTPNRNAAALIDLVRQHRPQLFLAVETDAWWQQQLDVLDAEFPYSVKCPLDNLYGMLLYSKLPLAETELKFLVEDDIPSIHTLARLPAGIDIRFHFLHPAPPSPSENEESTERDAELIMVARSTAEYKGPVIVTGDLNDVAWSSTTRLFRKVSGLLDPRVGRGMFNTYNAKHWFLRWPLDHLFHSNHFSYSSLQRLPGFGSDHFPLLAELNYEPNRANEQDSPVAQAEDIKRAHDKMAQEQVSADDVPAPG